VALAAVLGVTWVMQMAAETQPLDKDLRGEELQPLVRLAVAAAAGLVK
jgi:hypothetical protein